MDATVTVATERNPRTGSDDEGASPRDFRHTHEYAAAFDLEVWKAQQQARFRFQLRQAKAKLEKRIYTELQYKNRRQIDELIRTRAELEQMAAKLEAAGEALQKRHAQLEACETAFDARRVRVAEQHETHLSRVEQRARRAVEESASAVENFKAQLRERDGTIQQLQERLHCAQSEYDMLQRRTARHLAERDEAEPDSDRAQLRESQALLQKAEATIQLLEGQLRQHVALVDRLSRDHDVLMREHHECQLEVHALRRERVALLSKVSAGIVVSRSSAFELPQRGSRAVEAATIRREKADDDLLLRMVYDLKRDITQHVDGHNAVGSAMKAPVAKGVVCERGEPTLPPPPPLRQLRQQQQQSSPSDAQSEGYIVAEDIGGVRAARTKGYDLPTMKTGTNVQTKPHSAFPTTSRSQIETPQGHGVAHCEGGPQRMTPTVVFQEPNASIESSDAGRYVHVDARTPKSDRAYPGHDRSTSDAVIERCEEVAYRGSALPPLAPTGGFTTISPSPEDFAQASAVASNDAETTLSEMDSFVRLMKINREKLLETGVYTIDSPIVKEMSEKIALYEQYLSRH